MVTRILVGFDGSDESRLAARWAANLAKLTHARIDLVAVVRPPDIASDVETEDYIERSRAHSMQLLEAMREELVLVDGRIAMHVLVGHPAEHLVRYAQEHHADLIVVGHRNRHAVQQWLTGSAAKYVMEHAPCSVTIVR